ncbi:hypothetical protein [Pseudoxanthomonas sp. PXM01]|uniref:phosphoribosyltransferase-like protein n=1 Tax=Pseudoxanthomonas sp. PXM01 TaxID=2769295 RepID=UPI0017805BDB|nr:hypothetical protein [Pseudoxanthomonas sp. PXM01]MBD9471253.1 hypothetical protein [Pseudoxanthomonas sp. PXM01]
MAFEVPGGYEGLSRQVFQRFRSLVAVGAIDIVTPTAFDAWTRNFNSEEEKYLAAQMLSASVIRTDRMKKSSYRQIIEVIIPDLLRSSGLWNFRCIGAMEDTFRLPAQAQQASVRFMPVDGRRIDARPGNSGESILREFGIQARIADPFFVRADSPNAWRNPPRLLILLDDLLGTGTQINRFARAYNIANLPATTECIYVPLLATESGIQATEAQNPRIQVRPVETLGGSSAFFSESVTTPGAWGRDHYNSANDARRFYQELIRAKALGAEGTHSLELTVLLPGRPPNNTLKAYWAESDQWTPLLRR